MRIEYSAHTAKQSHSNCDEQHNTHRPTETLKQVLPNDHSSARNHRQRFSSPSPHNHHSHLRHTSLDVTLFQAFRTQICVIVFTWNSSKFASGQCVRLRLYCAQRDHVLFCTLDVDDTITNSQGYAVEILPIFAVLLSPMRVSFPHRFLRHCLAKNCPDTLWLFRIHFRVRAVHHSIVQVLGNCFVTDSLDQLFDVRGDVQPCW